MRCVHVIKSAAILTYSWSVLVHEEQEVVELDTIRWGGQDIIGMTKGISV